MIDQISATDLAALIDSGESFTLVDTRPEDSYEGWHLHGAENVPFGPEDELEDDQLERIVGENGESIVAICGKGLTSTTFAFQLQQRGYDDVAVVKGGMEDWSTVYEVVPLETDADDLVAIQLQRRAKGSTDIPALKVNGAWRFGDGDDVDLGLAVEEEADS